MSSRLRHIFKKAETFIYVFCSSMWRCLRTYDEKEELAFKNALTFLSLFKF